MYEHKRDVSVLLPDQIISWLRQGRATKAACDISHNHQKLAGYMREILKAHQFAAYIKGVDFLQSFVQFCSRTKSYHTIKSGFVRCLFKVYYTYTTTGVTATPVKQKMCIYSTIIAILKGKYAMLKQYNAKRRESPWEGVKTCTMYSHVPKGQDRLGEGSAVPWDCWCGALLRSNQDRDIRHPIDVYCM